MGVAPDVEIGVNGVILVFVDDDILAKCPKSVWFQLGIRNEAAAERLARAGIDVIQDRCLMVELRLLPGSRAIARAG